MAYLSYTFLYISASVFIGVFSQNHHGVPLYSSATQNCSCASNAVNESNAFFINSMKNRVGILPELSINTMIPILVVPDELKCNGNVFSLTSNLGTLQLWLANNVPGNTSETIDVFDSQNLSNPVGKYDYTNRFVFQNSSTGSFSISQSSQGKSELDWSQWFYYVFRIEEKQFSNCKDIHFVNFLNFSTVFPFEKTFILNAAANTSGNCLTSILLPYVNATCQNNLPILYISSITYAGPSSVKVLSTIYNESYELFEFSEGSSKNWNNFVIYGNLISFIIPPNGALHVEYKALTSATNITEYDFEDYGLGIIQSSDYPRNSSIQYTSKLIKCTKGTAKITIQLIYVEVPVGGYLQIIGQDQTKTYQNGIFANETIVFNSNEVNVDYFLGADGQTSTGLLLLYEANSDNGNKAILQKTWLIIILALLYY